MLYELAETFHYWKYIIKYFMLTGTIFFTINIFEWGYYRFNQLLDWHCRVDEGDDETGVNDN